jgi:hypothetical protein
MQLRADTLPKSRRSARVTSGSSCRAGSRNRQRQPFAFIVVLAVLIANRRPQQHGAFDGAGQMRAERMAAGIK